MVFRSRVALAAALSGVVLVAPVPRAQVPRGQSSWIDRSNQLAQPLLQLEARYEPEGAAQWGVSGLDEEVSQFPATRIDQFRKDTEAVIAGLQRELAVEKDPHVAEDLRILIKASDDMLKDVLVSEKYELPYFNPSALVFNGIRSLLDDQIP